MYHGICLCSINFIHVKLSSELYNGAVDGECRHGHVLSFEMCSGSDCFHDFQVLFQNNHFTITCGICVIASVEQT